jgi:DNA-3-methyladenine glycosylase II
MAAIRERKQGNRVARRAKTTRKRIYHPGPPIADEAGLLEATQRLRAKDPELVERLIAIGGPPPLRRREAGFAGLAAIIVALDAAEIAKATEEDLRACGLSNAKIRALHALSQAIVEGGLDLKNLADLGAEDAHKALVAVKGVGPWTADVFLLFCLGHPDAFPAGDVALQEAAKVALNLKRRPDAERLERIAERWRPLRGVAARMLWAYYRASRRARGWLLQTVRDKRDEIIPGADIE